MLFKNLTLLKIIMTFSFVASYAEANKLIFDVSNSQITLGDKKKQSDFTIYGFSDSKRTLVLKITGPRQKVILQKKKKILGMWTWGKTGEFSYPSLNHYYTNNKSNQIDFEIKKDLYDNIKLIGKDDDNLKKDLIEKKMSIELFKIKNNSFNVINKDVPSLFKIPIKLPENSPAGDYFVSMSLMDSGDKFETRKVKLTVKKLGVSSFIFSFAHKFSFIYGVFSAIIAIALGVFASVVFRKR
tara:strand:- start:210 stop:932 length:723 start_codon:yes stop_codon:yes gene_type:complete